jgi:hypothetical protein
MLFLLCLLAIVNAAPVPDGEEVLSWSPAPKTRGTFSILFSCATALSLCIWTGVHVHLNFDPSRGKTDSKYLVKTVWAVFALVAPDIVLAVALHQLLVAREYRRAVNEESTTRSGFIGKGFFTRVRQKRDRGMSLKTAFFTIMGGFSIAVSFPDGTRHRNKGLDFSIMTSDEMIDTIYRHPVDQTEDRNKTSSIAKFLACIQVGWILMQCFGREIEHIYITLLELNTAVHVLIAIVMFGIWWDKPVDINQPIVILEQHDTLDFTSSNYRNFVSQVLRTAEDVLLEDLRKDHDFEHQEAWLTVVVFKSIRSVPQATVQIVKRIQVESEKVFMKRTLMRDLRDCVMTHYRYSSFRATPAMMHAASIAAFEVAEGTASEVAGKSFNHALKLIASESRSDPEFIAIVMERACQTIRKITFRIAFKAALDAAGRAMSLEILKEPISRVPEPERMELLKSPNWVIIRVAFGAAHTAVRSACRQAVRLATLKAALGGASSAGIAFFHFLQDEEHSRPLKRARNLQSYEAYEFHAAKKDQQDKQYQKVQKVQDHFVGVFRGAVEDALRNQYHIGVNHANIGPDADPTTELVLGAISAGIYKTACFAIDRAIKSKGRGSEMAQACFRAKVALLALEHGRAQNSQPQRSCREHLRDFSSTAVNVFWGQLIDIPDLFWPQVGGGTAAVATAVPPNMIQPAVATAVTSAVDPSASAASLTSSAGTEPEEELRERHPFDGRIQASPPIGTENPYSRRDTGIHVFEKPWRKHRIILVLFASIAGAFYGALHLTKWNNSVFPTETERLLWRMSCCVGMASVLPVTFLFFMRFARSKWLRILCIIICALSWTAFLSARVFIIVESFISLRALPKDAFQTVEWTFAIPHV